MRLLVIAIWVLLCSAPVRSESLFTLHVGIDEYQSTMISSLQGAVNDAEDIYAVMQRFAPLRSELLLDEQATRHRIMSTLRPIFLRRMKATQYCFPIQVTAPEMNKMERSLSSWCSHHLRATMMRSIYSIRSCEGFMIKPAQRASHLSCWRTTVLRVA